MSNNAEYYQQQETQILNTTLRNKPGDTDLLYDVLLCCITNDVARMAKKVVNSYDLRHYFILNVSVHSVCPWNV
jgi:hypothetical protein